MRSDPRVFCKLDLRFRHSWQQRLFDFVAPPIEAALAIGRLNRLYAAVDADTGGAPVMARGLHHLGASFRVSDADLAHIPRTGPAIVVANHPFGAVEGMVLATLLQRVRPDFRIMANYLLSRIRGADDVFIYVDPFGGTDAAKRNLTPLKAALRWLRQGGLLAIFPAGEVAHWHLREGRVTDPPWSDVAARLVRHTKAPVVPVFFVGRNGMMFQAAGLLHPRLRTALLPRELLNKSGKVLDVRVGTPLPAQKLLAYESDADLTAYLRLRTYILQHRGEPHRQRRLAALMPRRRPPPQLLLIEPVPADALAGEVGALPEAQLLATSGELRVYFATAQQAPQTLREIGRLREETFRLSGEGTGRAFDLDRFDEYYRHLFIWHAGAREVVGAYRIGHADEIVTRSGPHGLYSYTLFQYHPAFLRQVTPALELGRSFIRASYQRGYQPLMLLWKGIAEYVLRHPRYRYLFGPVSIASDYRQASHQLIVDYLRFARFETDLARFVRARIPFRRRGAKPWHPARDARLVNGIEEVNSLVAEIEAGGKGIPVLLKQYLKLGGMVLGFNLDPDFSDVLDGLVLVDLHKADPQLVERFMGRDGYRAYLAAQPAAGAGVAASS